MLWSLLRPRTKIVSFGCYGCCVCCAGKCGGTCVGGSEVACGALILHQGVRLWVSCAAVGGCQRALHHRRSAGRSSQLTNFCSIEAAMPLWWHCSQSNTTKVGNKKRVFLFVGSRFFPTVFFLEGWFSPSIAAPKAPPDICIFFIILFLTHIRARPERQNIFTFIFFCLAFHGSPSRSLNSS